MRILVTGASGQPGRETVNDLAAHGHDAVGIDQMSTASTLPGRFVQADLRDTGHVAYAMWSNSPSEISCRARFGETI